MVLAVLLGCSTDDPESKVGETGTDPVDSQTTGEDSVDSEDGVDTADLAPTSIEAEIATVQTVVRVRWTTPTATTGYVRFGPDTSYALQTPLGEASTEHEVLLLGNHAETEVHFQVVSAQDGVEVASEDQMITTGPLPPELPELTTTGAVSSWPGNYLIIPYQGSSLGVVIVDDQGAVVWYDTLDGDINLMSSILSVDGQSVVHMAAGSQGMLENGSLIRVSLDGDTKTPTLWPYIDHDFTELPDGTIAAIVLSGDDELDGTADTIQEMAPDGTITKVFDCWDDEHISVFYNPDLSTWTHANGLDYDPEEDAYYLSMKEIGTIVKVDRQSGEPLWHLNGDANQFSFPEGTEIIQMQHQFHKIDGGMVIFDNGELDRGYSRAVEYTLDEDALEGEQIWEYIHDPPIGVYAKGDVERYADGNTRVVWSSSGEIQDVDPDGNVIWQLNAELGYAFTFVYRAESFYVGL